MKRVDAIRAHVLVGRGSCSSIDECYSDEDLIACMDGEGVETTDIRAAVEWALNTEQMYLEQGTNASSGEEGCELVAAYREFKRLRAAKPASNDEYHKYLNDMKAQFIDNQEHGRKSAEEERECSLLNSERRFF